MLNSSKEHLSALQDGKFLVEFYTCHSNDKYFNAINQCYYLEYHPAQQSRYHTSDQLTHLIRPSASSAAYSASEGLAPF